MLFCFFFYIFDVPTVRNYQVENTFVTDVLQVLYLADGMTHVVSYQPSLTVKNDSRLEGLTISTQKFQACIVWRSCSSTFSFSLGELDLTSDKNFSDAHSLLLIVSIQVTQSIDRVFKQVTRF